MNRKILIHLFSLLVSIAIVILANLLNVFFITLFYSTGNGAVESVMISGSFICFISVILFNLLNTLVKKLEVD